MISIPSTTLRALLTEEKPGVSTTLGFYHPNSSDGLPEVRVRLWSSFSAVELNDEFGDILDATIKHNELPRELPSMSDILPGSHKVKSCQDVFPLVQWIGRLMAAMLPSTIKQLKLQPGLKLKHTSVKPSRSGSAETAAEASLTEYTRPFRIPGAGPKSPTICHLVELDSEFTTNLVLGISTPSKKCFPRNLLDKGMDGNMINFGKKDQLLRRLAQGCHMAGTRYGYILTEGHIIVCHLSKTDDAVADAAAAGNAAVAANALVYNVQVRAIPWTHYGSGDHITAELGIWWLVVKALKDLPR